MTDAEHYAAFVAALTENPEDRGTLLVFADFLEECGETEAADYLHVMDECYPVVSEGGKMWYWNHLEGDMTRCRDHCSTGWRGNRSRVSSGS